MSEFCENCPLRGQMQGEIAETVIITNARIDEGFPWSKNPVRVTAVPPVGVFLDEAENPSEPIYFPTNRSKGSIISSIGDCEGPILEDKGILKPRYEATDCSSIGQLTCNDQIIVDYIKSIIK